VAAAAGAATDFELIGVIDDGLDPQDTAVLVVHLDPVALHPVLDAGAGPAPLPVGEDVAREAAVELAAEEGEPVLGVAL
jgi:hypothetical protein